MIQRDRYFYNQEPCTNVFSVLAATTVRFGVVVLGVDSVPTFVDNGVESVILVGRVFDGSHRAVGVVHRVRALQNVSVAVFVLAFHVPGVRVLDSVVERVFRVSLRTQTKIGEMFQSLLSK